MKSPEDLSNELKKALGETLVSVVHYGSSVQEGQAKYGSTNVLVVVKDLSLETLKKGLPVIKKWKGSNNPAPFFFTEERIKQAEDVFPLEFLDIKSAHTVLYGRNPFESLEIQTKNLRHQLEYELRSKLIHLREMYFETDGKEKRVQELMARSISTFTMIFRGVLRLVGETVPAERTAVWEALKKHVPVNVEAFSSIYDLRLGKKPSGTFSTDDLFDKLLASIEATVDFVDKH